MVVGLMYRFSRFCTPLALLCLALGQARAVTLKEARQLYATGEYTKAIKASEAAIAANEYDNGWRLLMLRARLTTGQYPEAMRFATELLRDYRYRVNAEALWLFHLAYEANGDAAQAGQMLQVIMQFLNGQRGISDENTLIFIGRALLKAAATDPKQVKENLFDRVLKSSPDNREALLATGELASPSVILNWRGRPSPGR